MKSHTRLYLIKVPRTKKRHDCTRQLSFYIGCSVKVAHSYILQTPGIIRLIALLYIGSVNYHQIYQTGVFVIENLFCCFFFFVLKMVK